MESLCCTECPSQSLALHLLNLFILQGYLYIGGISTSLFVVSWILEHVIPSVIVSERHESWTVARCFTSHISNFSKCVIQKHCELETLDCSRQDWVMARQDRVIHCQAANKSNLFDDVRYLPWSQSWCTHSRCQSLLRVRRSSACIWAKGYR